MNENIEIQGRVHFGIEGEYMLEAIRPDGSIRPLLDWTDNLVTNDGLNGFGTLPHSTWSSVCRVGTGNTAPANGDTALVAQVASINADATPVASWDGGDNHVVVLTRVYTSSIGGATGVLAEVGLSDGSSANLHTRSLFTDGSGSPVTVTVLADEQLRVTYRIKFHVVETDSVWSGTTDGTAYTLTLRPSLLSVTLGAVQTVTPLAQGLVDVFWHTTSNSAWWRTGATSGIGTVEQAPSGTQSAGFGGSTTGYTLTRAAYVNGNYYRDTTLLVGSGVGNTANTGALEMEGSPFRWQLGFSPRVNKVNTKTMTLNFRTSWGRYEP